MNWEALGAIGEVVGALAVIATLIYLALQMRQNNRLLENSLATSTRESTNQVTGLLASDREALRVFWAGIDGRGELSDIDRQHFDALISLYFEALLQSYQQGNSEGLSRSEWMLAQKGIWEFWDEYAILYEGGFAMQMSERIKHHRKAA